MLLKLWQTLEKEHLDLENELSNEEWNLFVEEHEDDFANFTSRYGSELFNNFLNLNPHIFKIKQ
tara:strand:+ start:544 stop:735 length:192 start_codon:yes stop_codon:yes gene_type:complete